MARSFILDDDTQRLGALTRVLASAGFNPQGILETIGVTDAISIKESDMLLLMHRTAGGAPLHTLIRLFLIEAPVSATSLAAAIAPMTPGDWVDMGLIRMEGDTAYATVRIFPYLDMVIAYDLPRRLLTEDGPDYVMGVGGKFFDTREPLPSGTASARPSILARDAGFRPSWPRSTANMLLRWTAIPALLPLLPIMQN